MSYVFTDGSSLNNGRKDAKAGYGVFFGDGDPRNQAEPLPKELYPPTNNRAELFACIRALQLASGGDKLTICTDSRYVMDSMTVWLAGWKKRGWKKANKKPVLNVDLIKTLDDLIQSAPFTVEFRHVYSHGKKEEPEFFKHGNEMADALANEGAAKA